MSKENATLPTSLTQNDFAAVAEHCYRIASPLVIAGQPVAPVLIVGCIRDSVLQAAPGDRIPIRSDKDKQRLSALMQTLVEKPDVDFVVHITEAWLRPLQQLPYSSMVENPQRQEAVIFNILSKDCQTVVINPLHRNPSRLERGQADFESQLRGGQMMRSAPLRN